MARMPDHHNDNVSVGVIVKITNKDGTAEDHLFTVERGEVASLKSMKDHNGYFPLGVFQSKLQLLLACVKNNLKIKEHMYLDNGNYDGSIVTLLGLAIGIGKEKVPEPFQYLTYSTLPFVYLCDNAIGTIVNGSLHCIPIYTFLIEERGTKTLGCVGSVNLDRQNGYFYLGGEDRTKDTALERIPVDDQFDVLIEEFNRAFLQDGTDTGNNFFGQLRGNIDSLQANEGRPIPFGPGRVVGTVLTEIADRWFNNAEVPREHRSYNIGSAIFLTKSVFPNTEYRTLLKSYNKKDLNRAAHAEVRLIMFSEFFSAVHALGASADGSIEVIKKLNYNNTEKWSKISEIRDLAKDLLALEIFKQDGNKPFALFSTMLPCYLCEGEIVSDEQGCILSINGVELEEGVYSAFPGTPINPLIDFPDVIYFDIDAAVNYRQIDVNLSVKKLDKTRPETSIRTIKIHRLYMEMFESPFINITTPSINMPISSMAVRNCGDTNPKKGLQNDETAVRYMICGKMMQTYRLEDFFQKVENVPDDQPQKKSMSQQQSANTGHIVLRKDSVGQIGDHVNRKISERIDRGAGDLGAEGFTMTIRIVDDKP